LGREEKRDERRKREEKEECVGMITKHTENERTEERTPARGRGRWA